MLTAMQQPVIANSLVQVRVVTGSDLENQILDSAATKVT